MIEIALSPSESYINPNGTTEDSDSLGEKPPANDSIAHYLAEPFIFGQTESDNDEKVEGKTYSDHNDSASDEDYVSNAGEAKLSKENQVDRSFPCTVYNLRPTKNVNRSYRPWQSLYSTIFHCLQDTLQVTDRSESLKSIIEKFSTLTAANTFTTHNGPKPGEDVLRTVKILKLKKDQNGRPASYNTTLVARENQ